MKVFVLFFCIIGMVYGEACNADDTTSCAHEICTNDTVPTCERNICTCNPKPTQPPGGCSTLTDCDSYWFNHHCGHHNRVCEQGQCRCSHGHGR